MRLAYLSTFYPFRGGIAQFNASLLEAFVRKGAEAEAFTFTCQYPGFLFPGKTQMVTEGDTANVVMSRRVLSTVNPFSYFSAASAINAFNPDILLMKYWMPFFGPSLGTVASRMKPHTKSIAILDNVLPHEKRFFDKAFNDYFMKRIDGFVAMSEQVKGDLLRLKPDAKVILLPHPVYDHFGEKPGRDDACRHLGIDSHAKNLLFFGFIRSYKGLDVLIEAFGKLPKDYRLIVAGESYGSFEIYRNSIEANPNKENIHVYNDYIADNRVGNFFAAADVCILPYKSATQSGITGISYHFDTPIIATNKGGLSEFVQHGKTGIVVEDANSELLAESIIGFFEKHDKQKFADNIGVYKKQLSWEHFAVEVSNFAKHI